MTAFPSFSFGSGGFGMGTPGGATLPTPFANALVDALSPSHFGINDVASPSADVHALLDLHTSGMASPLPVNSRHLV
jgi:hypothetical protein